MQLNYYMVCTRQQLHFFPIIPEVIVVIGKHFAAEAHPKGIVVVFLGDGGFAVGILLELHPHIAQVVEQLIVVFKPCGGGQNPALLMGDLFQLAGFINPPAKVLCLACVAGLFHDTLL